MVNRSLEFRVRAYGKDVGCAAAKANNYGPWVVHECESTEPYWNAEEQHALHFVLFTQKFPTDFLSLRCRKVRRTVSRCQLQVFAALLLVNLIVIFATRISYFLIRRFLTLDHLSCAIL